MLIWDPEAMIWNKETDKEYIESSQIQGNNGNYHDDENYDHGLPAYSNNDKIPPWWGNVSNDKGGNVSVSNSHHI